MSDLLKALGGLAVMALFIYAMCRFVGLGACLKCGRAIPPWNAYCYRQTCAVKP